MVYNELTQHSREARSIVWDPSEQKMVDGLNLKSDSTRVDWTIRNLQCSSNSVFATPAVITDIPLIDRKRVNVGARLGSGAFGDVHLGYLNDEIAETTNNGNKVAVKTLRLV